MADPLGQSTDRANQLTTASLPYRANTDLAGSILQGAESMQHIQANAQAMEINAANAEREKQLYGEKVLAMHAELDLRQKQAATQQLEAQTAMLRATTDQQLADIQKSKEAEPSDALMKSILENPVRLNKDGTADLATIDANGHLQILKGLDAKHPEVRRHLAPEEAKTNLLQAETDYYSRRPGDTGNRGTQNLGQVRADEEGLLTQISDLEFDLKRKENSDPQKQTEIKGQIQQAKTDLELTRRAKRALLQTTIRGSGNGAVGPSGATAAGGIPSVDDQETSAPPGARGMALADAFIQQAPGLAFAAASLPYTEMGMGQDEFRESLGALIDHAQSPNSKVPADFRSVDAIVMSMIADLQSSNPAVVAAAVKALRRAKALRGK